MNTQCENVEFLNVEPGGELTAGLWREQIIYFIQNQLMDSATGRSKQAEM
jgi:hypothetical protein